MSSSPPDRSKQTQFYAIASVAIVLALLYFGQDVLIPLALAVLIAFLLAPVVSMLERLRLGRVASTLLVVFAGLALAGGFGWIVEQRFVEIVNKLPEYRQGIQTKFHRLTRSGGVLEKAREELRQTVQEVPTTRTAATTQAVIAVADVSDSASPKPEKPAVAVFPAPFVPPSPDEPWAVRLYPKPASALDLASQYLGKVLSPVATAGLVIVFIIFMLIGRENLRDRMILLAGGGRLHVTTQAYGEAEHAL